MDKTHFLFALIFSLIIALEVVSFALCIASEFKRTKRKDLKLDGRLCFLPESRAFELGIAALICLLSAQIIGSLFFCRIFCSREKKTGQKARKPIIGTIFFLLSWVSFGVAVILISVFTSMNKRQPYGKGWLDGECYIVKDWAYAGAGIAVLLTLGSTLASAILTIRKSQDELDRRIHAQV